MLFVFFFVFKQKTAYVVRISDWSSDVCSSDLIRTDARVLGATLKAGQTVEYPLGKERKGYLVPAAGAVRIDDVGLNARDGAAISDVDVLRVTALEDSEIVLVDAV